MEYENFMFENAIFFLSFRVLEKSEENEIREKKNWKIEMNIQKVVEQTCSSCRNIICIGYIYIELNFSSFENCGQVE